MTKQRRCQQYEHPTQLCKEETQGTCAVCAQPHPTKEHPCKYPNCQAGPACKHPPIKCAAYNGLHKAFYRNCPARTVAFQRAKDMRKAIANGDHQSQLRPEQIHKSPSALLKEAFIKELEPKGKELVDQDQDMDLDDSESASSLESTEYPLIPGEALLDFSQTIPVRKEQSHPSDY
jgi:hypothetical protein